MAFRSFSDRDEEVAAIVEEPVIAEQPTAGPVVTQQDNPPGTVLRPFLGKIRRFPVGHVVTEADEPDLAMTLAELKEQGFVS